MVPGRHAGGAPERRLDFGAADRAPTGLWISPYISPTTRRAPASSNSTATRLLPMQAEVSRRRPEAVVPQMLNIRERLHPGGQSGAFSGRTDIGCTTRFPTYRSPKALSLANDALELALVNARYGPRAT